MCGIAGFIDPSGTAYDRKTVVAAMAGRISHRGPDDEGVWVGGDGEPAFGHRRLSVIDLSNAGHQPMVSGDGRFVMIYNGEVYNFRDIRRELEASGTSFKSDSDSEVVLEACAAWGIEKAVARFNGMFAFALWDRQRQTLALVLDRFAIKPLYWGQFGNTLLFGSELKALQAHPDFKGEIDRDALVQYLRFGYVPAPMSIYKGINKLEPGSILKWNAEAGVSTVKFWDIREVAKRGLDTPVHATDQEAADGLESILMDAVGCRMVSDVPLGAFLSGGIDSSIITALMQAQSNRPVKTFSIGFGEQGYDESVYAAKVAAHLGTDHTELVVTERDALAVIPDLASMYDEPFSDSSQIPTYLVSKLAREHVTVALSGDGGDEMFGGYNRHVLAGRIHGGFELAPHPVRKAMGAMLGAVPKALWGTPRRGDNVAKLARLMGAPTIGDAYQNLCSVWSNAADVVIGGASNGDFNALWPDMGNGAEKMMLRDAETYLPGDIMTKVDRASMAVSLEARVPFLDFRVAEYAWRLPSAYKVRNGQGKWLLRQVLDKHVPRELVERPKMGFGVPIDTWLRGELRDWAEELLDQSRLKNEGFFDPALIRRKWREHLSGRRNWQHQIWTVLMFQAWLDKQNNVPLGHH